MGRHNSYSFKIGWKIKLKFKKSLCEKVAQKKNYALKDSSGYYRKKLQNTDGIIFLQLLQR
jgi:hypothetical protein